MRKNIRSIMVAMSLACMVGCQTVTTENPFKLQPNDTKVTTAVLEGMLNNETVSNLNVHVVTTDGVVMLSGYVKTIRQSDTSEDIAKHTPGVKSVQNNIIVRK